MSNIREQPQKKRSRSRKGAPGILDVALRAEVSSATVSRYFNNPDIVRPPTRARIEKAARELGYIRDRVAGAMHGMMSGSVGLIVPTVDHAIFAELIEAFSARLHQHDRTMLIASHNYELDRETGIVRSLLERRIDAIALVGRDHPEAALEMLRVRGIPVVMLWNAVGLEGIPSIGTDNRKSAMEVTQHLVNLQHRKIALLFPDTQFNDRARDRLTGVMESLHSAGISVPDKWNQPCPYDTDRAKAVAMNLLQDDPPTAFICGNDIIAHGVIHAASRLGIRIPDELSVVGIGDFRGSSAIEPPLTTVRLPAIRIGQLAADTLIDKTHLKNVATLPDVQLPSELILRESTAIAPR
ncbi:LacI family DNA-binding transcriptional regulator [Granulosicoccus sp. 3-233]|uniref:LacI family DNA-binding transcriptional regulator n=1 Tax=Granulosicoccus sp. 3-233 TaxID=3417969 RepID=UPI003D326992